MADYTARPFGGGGAVAPYGRGVSVDVEIALAPLRQKLEQKRREADTLAGMKLVSAAGLDIARQVKARKDAVTGDGTGFADALENDWDAIVAPHLDAAPAAIRSFVETRLVGLRDQYLADAFDYETKIAEASRYSAMAETLATTANGIRSDGKLFHAALGDLEAMVAASGLPAPMQEKLHRGARQDYAVAYAQGLSERDPYAGRRLLDSGELDGYLEPGVKDRLLGNADSEIKQREREQRQAAREAEQNARLERQIAGIGLRDRLAADIASIVDTGVAADIDPDEVRAVLGEKEFVKWQRARERGGKLHEATTGLEGLNRDDIASRVAALEPVAGSETYAEDKTIYEAAAQRAQAVLKLRSDDPSAAIQTVPAVRAAADAVNEAATEQRPAAMTRFLDAQDAAFSEAFVAPSSRRYLTNAQADEIVARLTPKAGQESRGTALRDEIAGMARLYGKRWPSVMKQLVDKGLPPAARALAQLGDAPGLATRMAAGMDAAPDLDGALSEEARRVVKNAGSASLGAWDSAVGGGPNGARLMQDARAIVQNVARSYVAGGMGADQAEAQAAEDFNALYDIEGTVIVPSREAIDASDAARVARDVVKGLTAADLQGYDALAIESADDASGALLDSLFAEGGHRWRMYGEEAGLELLDANGLPVRRRDGQAVRLSWAEVRTRLEAAPGRADDITKRYGFGLDE